MDSFEARSWREQKLQHVLITRNLRVEGNDDMTDSNGHSNLTKAGQRLENREIDSRGAVPYRMDSGRLKTQELIFP